MKELVKHYPNPFYGGVYFDSCAFDGGLIEEQTASVNARRLFEEHGRFVNIVHSVGKEIDYPSTPQWVKDEAIGLVFTIENSLTASERDLLAKIESVVVGNGSISKMRADCRHIFEAQKYGRYFVTADKRLLKKSDKIFKEFTLYVLSPSEFLKILEQFVLAGRT